MKFKIRTKLVIGFLSIIFPFLIVFGIVALYNMKEIDKNHSRIDVVMKEFEVVSHLQLGIDMILMPGNDYIISGDRRYIEDFKRRSEDLEKDIRESESVLASLADLDEKKKEIFKDFKNAYKNIKELSLKIFEIQKPIGNKDALSLMEEMDYKWSYPIIERLKKWHEINDKEHRKNIEGMGRVMTRAWIIMIAGSIMLLNLGILFSFIFSRRITYPIESMQKWTRSIEKGDFKTRLDIKTGDELQQLSNAMNEMAAQLDNSYATLEQKVEERTRELKESETRFHGIVDTAKDAMVCIEEGGIIYLWNKSAEEMFGYKDSEVINRNIHEVICPERYKEKAGEGFKEFSRTGTGTIVGKTIEMEGLKKDGTEFPVELSISTMNIKGKWHAVGIIRDITGRKETEKKIAEQLDYLERFQKATIQREFRMKELSDEVNNLKTKIKELEGGKQ